MSWGYAWDATRPRQCTTVNMVKRLWTILLNRTTTWASMLESYHIFLDHGQGFCPSLNTITRRTWFAFYSVFIFRLIEMVVLVFAKFINKKLRYHAISFYFFSFRVKSKLIYYGFVNWFTFLSVYLNNFWVALPHEQQTCAGWLRRC